MIRMRRSVQLSRHAARHLILVERDEQLIVDECRRRRRIATDTGVHHDASVRRRRVGMIHPLERQVGGICVGI